MQRLFDAALEEVQRIDAVVLPEGRLTEPEVEALEGVLAHNDVRLLISGLRPAPGAADRFPANSLHIGVRLMDHWWHSRQNKHHRWFLDAPQIETYTISGALHPSIKWWDAMDIPHRRVHFVELGGGITLAAVICEDLARQDGVAQLLRSVGPTLVVTLLLDGPQLASRYAGVLAEDPGSAVVTLTAYGMTSRSQPNGGAPSPVVAMCKDPVSGVREIPLESGAQGVLLKAVVDRAPRYCADGRSPADDAVRLCAAGAHQLRARPAPAGAATARRTQPADLEPVELDESELSILTSWVEGMADYGYRQLHEPPAGGEEALREAVGERIDHVRGEACAGSAWRARMGLPEPSARLDEAFDLLGRIAHDSLDAARQPTIDAMLEALDAAARLSPPTASGPPRRAWCGTCTAGRSTRRAPSDQGRAGRPEAGARRGAVAAVDGWLPWAPRGDAGRASVGRRSARRSWLREGRRDEVRVPDDRRLLCAHGRPAAGDGRDRRRSR